MNIDTFQKIVYSLYSKELCYAKSSHLWNKDNPCIGMCAITSLLVHEYFGYEIGKIKVDGISHYFNLCNGDIIDLTKNQFNHSISYSNYQVVNSEDLLKDDDTSRRYLLLKQAFIEHMKNHFYMIPMDESKSFYPKYRYAVITILRDGNGRYILQRRGSKARDEVGRLEEIGGAFEDSDSSLKDAMEREIKEEVGTKALIHVGDEVGRFLNTKYDLRTNEVLSWLFVLYESFYEGGELLNQEPLKCSGYEFYEYDSLPWDEMSESSKVFNQYYKNVRG